MEIINLGVWVFYVSEAAKNLDEHKCGKWMYFFDDEEFVAKICKEAVEKGIVVESKHSDAATGVSCFYLECDDLEGHKKVIQYFLDNNLIKKTKAGKLYNISFKLDAQTRAGEYGDDFQSEIKLEKFIDLYTGKWII